MAMARDYVTLNDDQFAKLVELLTPGYQLAMVMLADRAQQQTMDAQQRAAAAAKVEEVERGKLLAEDQAKTEAQERAANEARAAADLDRAKAEAAEREAKEMADLEAEDERERAAINTKQSDDRALADQAAADKRLDGGKRAKPGLAGED